MKINIFDLKFEDDFIEEFLLKSKDILKTGFLTEGKNVEEFEKKFAKLVNAKYAIAVTNGTVAIELALKNYNIQGKKIIIPSNTFFATSIAVENAGGILDFVDIEDENFSICPIELRKKISKNTGAVILVHIGGIISKHYKEIKSICEEFNVPLIEDAAHAHLSKIDIDFAGTIGNIGCFSFFPTKVMTTGEGGMITTNDYQIYQNLKSLKNFGRKLDDINICKNPLGNNYKISEFTGLLGSLECDRVISRIDKRNILVNRYVDNLKNTSYTPILQDGGYCSYYKMIFFTKIDNSWLKDYCKKHNVSLTGEVYKIPVHKQPLYSKYNSIYLPKTEKICKFHICPPLYPELEIEEIDYVSQVLIKAEKEYEKQSC
jgi:dTDP-4-amino-4,6-dideoxygalactose transaminase